MIGSVGSRSDRFGNNRREFFGEVSSITAEFQDRVALVTDGSRGIGRATALRLASEGRHVAISYGSRRGPAEETAAKIERLGDAPWRNRATRARRTTSPD